MLKDQPVTEEHVDEDTLILSFNCPICGAAHEETVSKPVPDDARFSCQQCQLANYLLPVIGSKEKSLDEMSLSERVSYQLKCVADVRQTGHANSSMITQSIRLLFPTTTGLVTAVTATIGFILLSLGRSSVPELDFWVVFSLLGSGLGLGIVSLVFGPPAHLRRLYQYTALDGEIKSSSYMIRAIGNYHHVYPLVFPWMEVFLYQD